MHPSQRHFHFYNTDDVLITHNWFQLGASIALPCDGESTLPLRGQEGLDSKKVLEEIEEQIQEFQ